MKYGLSIQTIKQIQSVFAAFPQIEKAVIFGSRAKGNYKPGSDIDLTLHGAELTTKLLRKIENKLDDLLLPYTIDISVFDQISNPEFIEHILRVGIVFYEKKSQVIDSDKKPGWKVKKIGDVCDIFNGGTPDTKVPKFWGGNILWITPKDMGQLESIYIDDTTRKITDAGLKNSSAKILPVNSIILSSRAPIGHLAINTKEITTNQGCKGIVPRQGLSTLFLYYFLKNSVDLLNSLGTGTTFKELSGSKLAEVQIPIPPLPEQERIVAVLDEAFASIAQAKANAERNLVNARELFGAVLQGIKAEKEPLGNLVDIKTGKLNANAAVEGGEYPFFTCSREVYAIDNYAFDCEAILLAGNNASGDFNVKHYKGKFNAYQRTYVITVNSENRVLYKWLYFQLLNNLKEFKAQSVGANTKFLKLGMIQNMQILLPPLAEQRTIVERLDTLSAETGRLEAVYRQKVAALEALKKSILSRAFEGSL